MASRPSTTRACAPRQPERCARSTTLSSGSRAEHDDVGTLGAAQHHLVDAQPRLVADQATWGTSDAESSCSRSDTADGRLHHSGRLGGVICHLERKGARRLSAVAPLLLSPLVRGVTRVLRWGVGDLHGMQPDGRRCRSASQLDEFAKRPVAAWRSRFVFRAGAPGGRRTERSHCISPSW
jgi:hypothetical protein